MSLRSCSPRNLRYQMVGSLCHQQVQVIFLSFPASSVVLSGTLSRKSDKPSPTKTASASLVSCTWQSKKVLGSPKLGILDMKMQAESAGLAEHATLNSRRYINSPHSAMARIELSKYSTKSCVSGDMTY